jgi:hypothetical protein
LQENQGPIWPKFRALRDKVITSGKVGRIRRLDRENAKKWAILGRKQREVDNRLRQPARYSLRKGLAQSRQGAKQFFSLRLGVLARD